MNIKQIRIILASPVVVLVAFLVVRHFNHKSSVQYATVSPARLAIERKLIVPGTIVPQKEIDIKSTFSGVMEQLNVRVGDHVTKGQAIAKIRFMSEPKEYQDNLRRFQIAEAQYKNYKKNYERSLQLFEKGMVAPAEHETVQTNYLTAKAEYDAALKELQFVKGIPSDSAGISNIIYSTDEGTVLELPVKEGGSIMARGSFSEGTSIAKLASLNSLLFKGVVNEGNINDLKIGMSIKVIVGALNDLSVDAHLSLISPKGVYHDGIAKFDIEARIATPKDVILRAGYSANAEIVLERKENVMSLQEKYFIFRNDSVYVETVEDGTLKQRPIITGISDGINTEIISGIDSSTLINDKQQKHDKTD